MAGTYAKYSAVSGGGGGGGAVWGSITGTLSNQTDLQTALNGKANLALSNLASTAINQHLLPGTDGTLNLGNATHNFSAGFFSDNITAGGANARAFSFPGFSGFGQGTTYTMQIGSNTYGGFGDFASIGFINTVSNNSSGLFSGSFGTYTQGVDDLTIGGNFSGGFAPYLKFDSANALTIMGATGASLLWNTDAAGNIGDATHRPDTVFVKSAVKVGVAFLSNPTAASLVFGPNLPSITGDMNTLVGIGAGGSLTTGDSHTAIGTGALGNMAGSTSNTAIGNNALQSLGSGDYNVAIGNYAGFTQTFGSSNIWLGRGASGSADGVNNEMQIGSIYAPINNIYIHDTGSGVTLHPSTLTITSQVRVDSLGVGNSAAATTLGTVVNKMEIFDASGTSLGFIPIYDTIT